MKRRRLVSLIILIVAVGAAYIFTSLPRRSLVLTGIVTTDEVSVSSEIAGRLQKLSVQPGDAVKRGDVIGLIAPQEWTAEMAYFENSERAAAAQVALAEAELAFQEAMSVSQIKQAEATLSSFESQVTQAEADRENARLTFEREEDLHRRGVDSVQLYDQARTALDSAKAHVESLHKQVLAAAAAVDSAKASAGQVSMRRAALDASRQLLAAATAQKEKAKVHLGYTEVRAPLDGTVNIRAALQGEVLNAGQPIVTLIDQDNLWIRADVEETYIDRIHLGDKMTYRIPSGAEREGVVFFRGVDGDYATQRDVSRTKRDIKTFEIRLRSDNRERSLVVGLTAYVTLRLK
jgi:multidrug resistance efflux pump